MTVYDILVYVCVYTLAFTEFYRRTTFTEEAKGLSLFDAKVLEKSTVKKRKEPWCDHYKKRWHTRETCWKIHEKPPNWKKKPGNENRAFQVSHEEN